MLSKLIFTEKTFGTDFYNLAQGVKKRGGGRGGECKKKYARPKEKESTIKTFES